MKKYSVIILPAFILGIILTVFTYQAITIRNLKVQAESDHAALVQVVTFLNNQIQAAQKSNPQPSQQPKPATNTSPTKTPAKTASSTNN